ncbi:tetratricopeptide repeat protein [Gemmatimonadota bacterium DH-20]|uniref:Tetratricopeptide repeat protein n=1 Tax=Gaopeijia maritima TaxID=3119007 RepID=A0ABU9E821_9BACT
MASPLIRSIALSTAFAATAGLLPAQAQQPDDDAIPLYTVGLGPLQRPVTTSVEEAQAWFDQGLQLMYAFAVGDGLRSFRQAWESDPDCAMCWFGEAWALGPYLNGGMNDADEPRAWEAAQNALRIAQRPGGATAAERAMIEAMAVRYAERPDPEGRVARDSAYSRAMADAWARFPNDLEIGTLYGESLMLLEPRRGVWPLEKPSVQHIHRVLEEALARDISHPGACHLYIHATESTPDAGKAEPCADLLGDAIPGASHINHMPSHTYNRIGRWSDAVRANQKAWHSDQKAAIDEGFAIYPSHNLHMLLFAASMDGQSAVAIQAARDYGRLVEGGQFYVALALMRFGRFEELTELDDVPADPVFEGLWTAARGIGHLRTGAPDSAQAHLDRVQALIEEHGDEAQFRGHTATQLLGVTGGLLESEILRMAGDDLGALEVLERVVALEDALRYDEPEPLNFSARHWLGALELELGRAEDAEATYREALEDHPRNGWSLYGLEQSLRAQGRHGDAELVRVEFDRNWEDADIWLRSSRY